MQGANVNTRPWCPFCGQAIGKPKEPEARKLGEFSVGNCQCGAVYTSDPTGHNVGAAMIEAMVYACNGDWDLAWALLPDEDYLDDRLESYDEITHQIVETRKLDGRSIRGVLFFIRLQRDMAEIAARLGRKQDSSGIVPLVQPIQNLEPVRDPKRQKIRASKDSVKNMIETWDIDGLVDLSFDDRRTLGFIRRLLYEPSSAKRWQTIHILGKVCGRYATRHPGAVSDLLHRLFATASDSASTSWGAVEAIGAIVGERPDVFGPFARHLLNFLADPARQVAVIWALGTIAAQRPDIIRSMPFYQLFPLLSYPQPELRALTLRLLGRIRAHEAKSHMEKLLGDMSLVTIFEEGQPMHTTIASLAEGALGLACPQGEQQP